ncbi:MlaD family protein [Mycobacterium talmoniae]|uniref:Mammalian cell entry protein n=1 Tax=Mycobacterium talmoniae TaxID=1858794 RepID=A0A1S1NH07_9MYCO|nr:MULTISPECIES: MCE family protein [Mycobacterium]OHV05068.1 mammalian cell entry protein [Mycobacterium talmoniae]TDH55956.1 MCE family protein [Mycobacterium eburneum]
MPNSYDFDPRSPNNGPLVVLGVVFAVVALAFSVLMVQKSEGKLDKLVKVDLAMFNIGDGLPAHTDVKFRGVLVGSVSGITPSREDKPNIVHVDLTPAYAANIPSTVTARVVPSNAFAVSAVQLVDNGRAPPLRTGSVVHEDTTLPTVLFQNVVAKLRQLLAAAGRKPDPDSIGVIAALGEATEGRGQQLTDAGHDLNEILAQLNTVVSPDASGPSTLAALTAAAGGLRDTTPELFDALQDSIRPMRTIAEKRGQLTSLLSSGLGTTGMLGDAFDHQTDRLIAISTQLAPTLGVLADHAGEFHGVSTRLQKLANKFYDEAFNPDNNLITVKVIASFTPSRSYVRADCPRYGALEGPSCQTAPLVPTAPDLFPSLGSMGIPPPPGAAENRPNVTPPRHSMPGDGPAPDMPPPPPPPWQVHWPPPDAPPPPDAAPAPGAPPVAGAPPPLSAEVQQQSIIGGNVGPVGSAQEKAQLDQIVGGEATTATVLLLGPVARGSLVQITPGGAP